MAPHGQEHLEDGELVRYLDGESTVAERARIAEHLLRCGECSAAVEAMRAERRLLADLLAQLEVPELGARRRERSWAAIEKAAMERAAIRPAAVHQPPRRRRGLAAAAATAGLLLTSLAASPVRAFVADLWSEVASRTGLVRVTELEPEAIRVAGATIGFVPTSDTFVLEVRATQPEGTVLLGVSDGTSVNARAEGDDQVVNIRILPGSGMRIENNSDETGSYAVNVPASLQEVRVRIADKDDLVFDMETLRQSWVTVIELTPDGASNAVEAPR